MSDQLQYSVTGQWMAGERPTIAAEHVDKIIEFSAPPEFHGQPGSWTPEHFLLAAVASCFVVTFRAIAGFSKLEPLAIEVSVQGTLDNQGGYDFAAIVIKPRLTIRDEGDRLRANRILEKTEKGCLVARALKCPVTMEASVNLPQLEVQTEV